MLHGLPTTSTFDIFAGVFGDGLALDGEDGAVGGQQVGTLHALGARTGTNQQADVGVPEATFGSSVATMPASSREGAVVQFHHDALDGLLGLRQVEQLEMTG